MGTASAQPSYKRPSVRLVHIWHWLFSFHLKLQNSLVSVIHLCTIKGFRKKVLLLMHLFQCLEHNLIPKASLRDSEKQ